MTEIALVADLHGNWPAVQAVERDIRARGIQKIWCLGDLVGKGPSSAETYDWAMANCEVVLLGNWDEGIGRKQFPRDEFYYRQLGEARLARLAALPLEHHCLCSGRKTRLFHGRPIMPGPIYVHSDDALLRPYFAPDFQVVGYADVHRQGVRVIDQAGLLFNTGSVGNGLGMPLAQYAILRCALGSREMGPLDVSMVSVPYDREQTLRDTDDAEARGLVNAEAFRAEVRTGKYAR